MAITITEEMLRKADDYIGLEQKKGMAHYLAMACVEDQDGLLFERYGLKQQIMMGVLAQCYLHQDIKKQKITVDDGKKKVAGVLDACMSDEEYDDWAGSHVYAQINRIVKKGSAELGDKAYEMLNDHKTFGILLDKEINRLITINNDPIMRVKAIFEQEITPEKVQALFNSVKVELEKLQAQQEGAQNG